MRPTVKCDVDNVINNLSEEMVRRYRAKYEENISYEDLIEYDFSNFPAIVGDRFRQMFHEEDLWRSLEPKPYAKEYLKKLCEDFDVYLVTAASPESFLWKSKWILENFPFIHEYQIVCLRNKPLMLTDYTIDDYQENLKGDLGTRIIINAPWNRDVREYVYSYFRADDLKQAYETICSLERKWNN